MDLSIIIVNYNTTLYLKECLDSIIRFTNGLEYEIIVVDNNSTDRDIEAFPEKYPSVKCFFHNNNRGFGAGCNYGAAKAKGKYFAFVNPDVIFSANTFLELFNFMEANTGTGLASGAFTDTDRKLTYSCNNFPGYKWEFAEAFGGGQIIINKLVKELNLYAKINKPISVDWIYGACMFVRANVFKEINGFDESFFLYYEDVDLQYKIKKSGHNITCLPNLLIKHLVNSSVSSIDGRKFSFFHFHRSKIIYIYKNFSFIKRNVIRFMHIGGMAVRIFLLPIRRKFSGKRFERFKQYMEILNLYFSGNVKVLNSRYSD